MKVFQTLNGYMPTARPISCLFFIPLWWSDSTIWFVLRMIHKNISGRYIGTHWGRCSAPAELTRGQQRLSAEIYHTKSIGSWKKKLYHIRFCMIIIICWRRKDCHTLRFFFKFVSRAYCSKTYQTNKSHRKQKM